MAKAEPEKITRQKFPVICGKIVAKVWPPDATEKLISTASLMEDNKNLGALVLFVPETGLEHHEIHCRFIRHPHGKAEVMILPKTPQGQKYADLICAKLKETYGGNDFDCWVNPS